MPYSRPAPIHHPKSSAGPVCSPSSGSVSAELGAVFAQPGLWVGSLRGPARVSAGSAARVAAPGPLTLRLAAAR